MSCVHATAPDVTPPPPLMLPPIVTTPRPSRAVIDPLWFAVPPISEPPIVTGPIVLAAKMIASLTSPATLSAPSAPLRLLARSPTLPWVARP